jgi:hypothetical protein
MGGGAEAGEGGEVDPKAAEFTRELPDELVALLAGKGSPRLRSGQAVRLRHCFATRTSHSAQDDKALAVSRDKWMS